MHKSYLIKIAAVGTAGVLALAACSSSSKSSSSGGGLGGGGGSSSAGGGGNVKIGFIGPLSGDNAQLGINEYNAVVPCRGPGQPEQHLRLQGDPGEVRRRRRPVQGDRPRRRSSAGPSHRRCRSVPRSPGRPRPSEQSYDAAHLVLISRSATNATLTSLGFTTFHRVVPPDSLEGKEAADWLAKKAKSVFVVDDLSDYGKGVADAVEAELKAKGVSVRVRVSRRRHGLQRHRAEGEVLRRRCDVLRRLRRAGRTVRQGV